jgi:hypothetical protein
MRKALKQILLGVTLVTLVAVLCACQSVRTPTAHPQAALTVTLTATNKPRQTPTPPQAQATITGVETSESTITPPVPPTAIPDTWKSFTNASLNVTLRYPENWHLETSTRASGLDGFFELSTRAYSASEFDRLVNLCVLDANDPGLTSIYGLFPFISDWQGWDVQRQAWIGNGCVVLPSESAGSQAVLYARDTRPETRNQLLMLRADAAHFGGILSSLRFVEFSAQELSTGYYDSPFCKEAPKAAPVTTRQVDNLVISEYAIANATCDPWKHFDGFQTRLTSLSIDRSAIQERDTKTSLENANRALAPFGYQLVTHSSSIQTFDLLKGTDAIIKGLTNFSAVSVNVAGDDFIMWVQDNFTSTAPSEVRSSGVRTLTVWDDGFNSTWVGADLIAFDYSKDKLFPVGAPALVDISSNGRKIRTFSIPQMSPAGSPVRGLWSWQNHWVMEVAGVLLQDGELQNLKLGYEEIFDWHLVNDKPFFLMRQGKSFGVVYAGQVLPLWFDDIIYGDLCCDPARYTIQNSPNGSLFYALKGGVWFLVSIQTVQ